jgi:cytoskeletal protein RodZ
VPSKGGSRGLWLAAVALVVALAALGATLWVQYRAHWTGFLTTSATTTSATPTGPNPDQVADAKVKACTAFELASKAVNVTNSSSSSAEPFASTVQARLAMAGANTYLLERIDPATPPPLADAIRRYAANIADLTTSLLAGIGADDPAQAERIKDLDALNGQITDLCK